MATPDYTSDIVREYSTEVQYVLDVYNGSKSAVKYLQRFSREADDAYFYRTTTLTLLNVLRETVRTTVATIFRNPLEVIEGKLTEDQLRILNDDAKKLTEYYVRDGLAFILVDKDRVDEPIITLQDELERGTIPYLVPISRSRVPNWTTNEDGSYKTFSIYFDYTENIDEYKQETKQEIRVFKDDGTVEIWRDGRIYETVQTGLSYVPVVPLGTACLPPTLDLARINVTYMNRRSELDRYLRISSAPVPVIWGKTDNAQMTIGVDQAILFSSKDEGDFEWKELTGKNYEALQADLDVQFQNMIEFTLSFVKESESVKTATQVSKEAVANESRLVDYATDVEVALNLALDIMENMGFSSVEIALNKDFDSTVLTPEQIATYIQLFNSGALSLTVLWDILIKGEVLPDNFDSDLAKEEIVLNNSVGTNPPVEDE